MYRTSSMIMRYPLKFLESLTLNPDKLRWSKTLLGPSLGSDPLDGAKDP